MPKQKKAKPAKSIDPISEIYFHARVSAAHVWARLAARYPKNISPAEVHNHLARHEKLANEHGLFGWLFEIWNVRALMYHVEGKAEDARRLIQSALRASAPLGYFRIFLHTWKHVANWALPLVSSVRAPVAAATSGYFSRSQSLPRWHGSSVPIS